MEPLSEVLRAVRPAGGVFLSADFTAPWCVGVRIMPEDCAPFLGKPAEIVGYHVVIKGRLLVGLEGEPMAEVQAGEIVLLPQNDDHALASAPSWLKGLKDPYIGRVLALIHHKLSAPWSAEALAREAGLSRSVFVGSAQP